MADRYLLLGGQVSIAWWQVHVSINWQQVSVAWGQVSIAWWTGIYSLADRYLLFGGQASIVWQMHLQDLGTYK